MDGKRDDDGDNPAETQAGETVKATHGAWDIVCATETPDQCTMRQIGKTASKLSFPASMKSPS